MAWSWGSDGLSSRKRGWPGLTMSPGLILLLEIFPSNGASMAAKLSMTSASRTAASAPACWAWIC